MERDVELDPTLFIPESELDRNFMISSAALQFVESKEVIKQYLKVHDPELLAAMEKKVKEMPVFKGLSELLGGMVTEHITVTPLSTPENDVSDEAFTHAKETKNKSDTFLISFTRGYQGHVAKELRVHGYDASDDELLEISWRSAWNTLKTNIQPLGGTVLAEVADFFDDLVRVRYTAQYDPVDRLRGSATTEDISTRVFYEVFEENLPRAIQRSGEDNWTGF